MKLLKVGLTFAVALLVVNEQTAQAATATTSFAVSATVTSACIVVATPLLFLVYDPSAADNDKTSTITVTCTAGTSYNIGLDKGANGASTTTRQMIDTVSTNLINYKLSSVVNQATNWGDQIGTDTVAATAALLPAVHTVYGRIPTGQYVTAGSYNDTINVTVTY